MSSFRKFTAALAALAVSMTSVFTFSVAVAATTFTDASSIASWATTSVTSLADSGVLSGRPDGSFDPQGQLNRAEVAKVAVLAAGLTEDTTGAPHFNDTAASDWFYTFVETLYNNGVVGGINGGALDSNGLATYNPGGTLNRAEGAKILVDAFDLETAYSGTPPNFPDVASSAWFYDYAETAYAHGIINGYDNGNFGPGDPITREQIAVIAKSSVDEAASSSKRRSDYTAGAASSVEPTETPTTPTTSDGDLNVAISASAAAAQTFPKGASSTAVAAYDFTATSDDVVITNLSIKRTGVGTDGDWTLYIYDGADRLTSGKTINSTSHEATFTGISVTVAAGTTKTLTLKADTAASSTGGDSFFEIVAAASVTSNAKSVGGSFPVSSTKQEINTNVTAGGITIEKNGSITNPKVGEDNVTVAKFKLTTATEAGIVKQIALIVSGSVSATDIQNAKLYQGTTLLASTAGVNSKDLLVFDLATPYTIEKGDSRNFEVKADLNTGRGSDTIQLYLDEDTDLVVTGGTYGFGVTVTSASYDGAATSGTCSTTAQDINDASCSLLQGGDITISSSGPGAADVAVNAKDVVLMDFGIVSVSEVTVKKFGIILTTNDAGSTAGGLLNAAVSNYTDIKITNVDTGAVLMGPIDATSLKTATGGTTAIAAASDTTGFYTFTDEFAMAAGESLNLRITADIANNTDAAFTNDTIYASLDLDNTAVLEIKDINNKVITNTASVVPTSDITGKTMSVKSASLTVTKSSTPVSDTAVKGTQDVSLLGLTMAAGAASDVKVTEMLVRVRESLVTSFNTANGVASDFVNNIELWVGGTKIAGPKGLTIVGSGVTAYYKATFDNMSYTIPAGSTIQIVVKGDLSSSAVAAYIGADIDPNDDITAEDKDGNTVTAGGTAALNAAAAQVPVLTISTGGSLTIAVDANTTKENIVVAGTSDVEISKFKFSATDEAFIVTKLSINNSQDGVVSTDLGEYDNNVTAINISYTNSSGATETKPGYLTAGIANFSGLDMLIDKDDDAIVTVSANLNTIAAGATAGEFVDLNLAFNDFEAVATGSGETYTGAKIDLDVAAASDLDIGTIAFTDPADFLVSAVVAGVAAGSSITFTADDGNAVVASGDVPILPVGTIVCFDNNVNGAGDDGTTSGDCDQTTDATGDSIAVITSFTAASAATVAHSYTAFVIQDEDVSILDTTAIYYSLPGTGYLTSANQMVVYETKPTLALSSGSPSGSRTQSASDNIFVFTISADAQEKVQIRTAKELTTCAVGIDATVGIASVDAAYTTTSIDGSSCQYTQSATAAAGDTFSFDAGAASVISGYARASFWIQSSVVNDFVDVKYGTNAAGTTTTLAEMDNVATLGAADCTFHGTASAAAMAVGTWYFCDVAVPTTTTEQYWHFEVDDISVLDGSDILIVDRLVLYNDKIEFDLAGDDIDTQANGAHGLVAYLKDGGSTLATAYVAKTTNATAETGSAKVAFYPISGTNSAIEVSKGTSKTLSLQLSTTTLIEEDPGEDDPLTVSMDLGSSASGTVTAGDFWWNDTNNLTSSAGIIKWLGTVDNTTLNGNTLKY